MAYSARATRNDDGSYNLSYGKGKHKLHSILKQDRGGWTNGRSDHKLKREAIAAWEAWAVSNYSGQASPEAENPATSVPDAPHAPHSGPPRYKRTAAVDDELDDNARAFFAILAEKRGNLTEWQRAQARHLLRQIGWPGRKPQEINDAIAKS